MTGRVHAIYVAYADFIDEINRMRALGRNPRPVAPFYGPEPSGGAGAETARRRAQARAWVPPADVYASGEDLVIELELPGVPPEAIAVTLMGRTLTVAGERRRSPGAPAQRRERVAGTFARTFELPDGVDASAVSAEMSGGVATITVRGGAAAAADEPHRVEVRHGEHA